MFPYRTFTGNGRGTNRPNTGIEASKTVGEASILRQVAGAFLPQPTFRRVTDSKASARTPVRDNSLRVDGLPARLSMLSFFMQRQWRYTPSTKKNVNSSMVAIVQRTPVSEIRGRSKMAWQITSILEGSPPHGVVPRICSTPGTVIKGITVTVQ